jgi:MoaA/NifB/PqqE/SkfB family radical SAM enzyme
MKMNYQKDDFFFYIDVLGSCNLKCPSCPVGNSKDINNPTGFMEPELLRQIIDKAISECIVNGIGLFNWTEPLLHPKLPELVNIVQSYGIPCYLSSNLNILKNINEILQANPYSFRVSVSGFNQSIYETTHRGGNIERVKENMIALAEAKQKNNSTTKIHVSYHRYFGNLDDELLMKKFAESLDFEFQPAWAYMLPLEKVLAYTNNDPTEANLTQEDLRLIDRLALPLREAIAASETHKSMSCSMRDNQMILDFQGNVQLCCAVYDSSKYSLSPYLSTPIVTLQQTKNASKTCIKCMDKGIHVYYHAAAPEFHALGLKNLARNYQESLGLDFHNSLQDVSTQIDMQQVEKISEPENISEIEQIQLQLKNAQDEIVRIKQSKFWKLKNIWSKLIPSKTHISPR